MKSHLRLNKKKNSLTLTNRDLTYPQTFIRNVNALINIQHYVRYNFDQNLISSRRKIPLEVSQNWYMCSEEIQNTALADSSPFPSLFMVS